MDCLLNCFGEVYNINVTRAHGCHLYTDTGRRIIDLEAGVWATCLGHNHPAINEAVQRQLKDISHLGYRYRNPVVENAARAVLDVVSMPDGKAIFLSSGSEAVEFGVQAIRRVSGRPLLLTLSGSYLAAYGSAGRKPLDEWHIVDQQHPEVESIPYERIGGFVFDGGNGSGLAKPPALELVQIIANRVRAHGGYIVANEITTGFGRTGKWFGCEHYGLIPDVVAMGKGMGNGYPVSAVVCAKNVADKLEQGGFKYAQSHQNDALGCAVALEVINVLREDNLVARSAEVGRKFLALLAELGEHPLVKEVRGRGLMLAVEFHEGLDLSSIHRQLFDSGFLVGCVPSFNTLRFYPSLTIEEQDLAAMVQCLATLLNPHKRPLS